MTKFKLASGITYFVELNKWTESEQSWSVDCFADLANTGTNFEHNSEGDCLIDDTDFYKMIDWWRQECEDWKEGIPCPDSFGDNEEVGNGDFWEINYY